MRCNIEEQADFWKRESEKYFKRNYQGKNLQEIPLNPYLDRLLHVYPLSIGGAGSILEIGCGAGNNLHHLKHRLKARRAVGIEPSPLNMALLSEAFPDIEFNSCDSHILPFRTDEFDVVVFRSVLHWVDRNYLMQTIGEAIRCARKYLIISDFSPYRPCSVAYHHQPQYRTFKMSYLALVEATNFMQCLASIHDNDNNEWETVQTVLFRKRAIEDAFPLRAKEDFEAK